MRRATLFVLSDNRSGSTLLDQCLGGHPEIVSLGEVHWLDAYVAQDRGLYAPAHELLCTCGKPVVDCPFWNKVERELGRPLGSLVLRQRLKRSKSGNATVNAIKHVPRRLLKNNSRLYRFSPIRALFGGPRLARDCVDLYDAVSAAAGRSFCVDSSKTPHRFRDVYALDPARTVAIVLTRDYKAVIHSKIKHAHPGIERGQLLRLAATGWRLRMQQIHALTADVPEASVFKLAYESLCEAPERELSRLCDFLGIAFDTSMLQRATENIHHIGGSPSKFDPGRIRISLDRSHEGKFSPEEFRLMRRLIGKEASRWGY